MGEPSGLEPHHRQPGEVGDELHALGRHVRPTEAGELHVGPPRADRADQERRVMVARGFAG